MTPGGVALLVAGAVPFAAFSWGVRGHFRSTGAMPAGMRLTTALSLLAFLWFCWRLTARHAAISWPLALLLFTLALTIFTWAVRTTRQQPPTLAFDDDRPSFLHRAGPYRYVRHPFYLAYLTFWTGTAVATPGLLSWVAPLVMLLLYADAARREERKFANSELAAAYAAYRAQAGMFLPRPSALLPQ